MEKMDGNTLAEYVAKKESGQAQMTIAQIKEVIGILSELACERPVELMSLLDRLGRERKSQ